MHTSLVRACRIAAFALSAAVAIAAIVVLAGWATSRPLLTTFGAAGVPMNPLTAVCLLLLGVALLLALPHPDHPIEQWAGRGLAACAAALALTKLATVGSAHGLDTWLFRDAVDAVTPVSRMSPNTAVILIPIALAVLLLDADRQGRRPAQILVVLAMPMTLLVVVGFLFNVAELTGWGAYIPMSSSTAVALAALQLAVLGGRVEYGFTHIFVAHGAGGVAARRLLPAAILVPLAIGYLRLLGQRAGLYGPEFGTVLFTLAMIVTTSLLVAWTARSAHRVDLDRAETEFRLQQLIRNVPLGIVVLDMQGRVRLCNDAFVELFHYSHAELMGRRVDDLIAPEGDGGETASMTQRGFAGENLRRTTVRRRRDGRLVEVELFVVPLSMDGRPIGTYGVYRDISDRRAARGTGTGAGL